MVPQLGKTRQYVSFHGQALRVQVDQDCKRLQEELTTKELDRRMEGR